MGYVLEHKGSVSAEHGVGTMKSRYMERQKGPEVLEYMRQLKTIFDPNNILNPKKIYWND